MRAVAAITLVFVAFGCDGSKPRKAPAASAPKSESSEPEQVIVSKPAPPPLFERHAAEPEPQLDPAQVPVEEDFIEEAEQRIGKNAKLELELARLKQEIQPGSR
jgi:hypothetical protein